jgi:hypothetical protein
VNCYRPYGSRGGPSPIFTINLSAGTTPFMMMVDDKEYSSSFYRLQSGSVNVTQAWYRPAFAEYKAADEYVQDHILNGGLMHKPLKAAINSGLIVEDPIEPDWSYERVMEWMLKTYGRRLGPLPKHGGK